MLWTITARRAVYGGALLASRLLWSVSVSDGVILTKQRLDEIAVNSGGASPSRSRSITEAVVVWPSSYHRASAGCLRRCCLSRRFLNVSVRKKGCCPCSSRVLTSPAERALRTQSESPRAETRYRLPSRSSASTGNEIVRPLFRPRTSRTKKCPRISPNQTRKVSV